MKSNEVLQKEVQDAIKWEPLLNAAEIGVIAKDGIITLTGTVDSFTKKQEAENAAKNVAGVKAVVEDILIKFNESWKKTEQELAKEVVNALKWRWEIPNDQVQVKVEKEWITLSGELNWNYQRDAAKKAASNVAGVLGVTNNISIKANSKADIEKKDIESALARNWSINDKDIQVDVSGTKVTLSGTVSSIYQKNEAERIAWNAPGVWNVDNKLEVEYDYAFID